MDTDKLDAWWSSLTPEQQAEARTIRSGRTPPPAWFTDGLAEFLRLPIYAAAYVMPPNSEDVIYTIRGNVLEFIAAHPVVVADDD